MIRSFPLVVMLLFSPSCSDTTEPNANEQADKVETSGKTGASLGSLPREVLAAAKAAQPSMNVTAAESETRDGRKYYDVAGRLPDGSDIELDLLQDPKGWKVVETQRDIALTAVPQAVRSTFDNADSRFTQDRIIESRQNDGIIIYEFLGPKIENQFKVEIKFDGAKAEVLTQEWAH